jgi:beta-lactamase regulating signal transducer with metallopeptidase domain
MNAILESLNTFSAAGLTAILNTLWLALAVAAVLWFALGLSPRVDAATRHAAWWAVLAVVMLLPAFNLLHRPAPSVRSGVHTAEPVSKHFLSSSVAEPLPAAGVPAPRSPLPSGAIYSRAAVLPRIRIPIELHPGNWPSRLLLLWMAVSSVLLGRIARSYIRLRVLLRRARPASADLVLRFGQRLREARTVRAPRLLVSDEVISPFAAGFLHPVVILPEILLEEITEPELDYVLLHELAHIARRDDWTNLMGRLASAVFVLHPVAAWVLGRIQREREIACDDWVVAATGSAVPYAVTLARLSELCSMRRRELLATGIAYRSGNLSERIAILLRPRLHFSSRASLSRVCVCVAAALALLGLGARTPGWIAMAKDTTVAGASRQAVPQFQSPARDMGLALESSPKAAPQLVAALSPAYEAQSPTPAAADQDKTWRHEWKLTRHDSSSNNVELSLILRDDDGNDRMNTQDVPVSSLAGFSLSALDHDGPVKFEYVRNAGSILCEGRVVGGRASGPFTVALNASFVSALEKMGYAAPHDNEAFSLVTSDVTLGYAQAVRDTGLTSSVSDLVELQDHGVSSDYVRAVRQEGFTDLPASNIAELRDHGVEPNYLKAIKTAGPNLSIEEIDSLRDHGVKPDYFKSMKTTAPQLAIGQINSLFDHGVEPDSYQGFATVDPSLSIEEIDSLRDHGVKPEFYRNMKSVDRNLSIEEVDSLFDHGVKPEYYRSMKSVDPNLSIEKIDSLYDHGVEPGSYKGFASVDSKLSIAEIDSLRDHGVEPEFYQGIKSADSTVSIEEVDRLRDHGVDPEYLKEIRALPDQFSIADISELRDHGISAKYIRNLHDMGMKNLKAAQIVRLRDGD